MDNMDNLENRNAGAPEPGLQDQIDSLRQTVFSLLVICVIISGTFLIFLFRQYRVVSRDLANIAKPAAELIAVHAKQAPMMNQFVYKLADYGKTHPDFMPIIVKYGLTNLPPSAAPTSVAPTAPSPAAAKASSPATAAPTVPAKK
jgi:hypothetical protein